MDLHIHWIKSYGYVGLFASQMLGMFGLPVPDETILTFAGFLISEHYLHPVPALLTAYLGSICGITLNYLVGRYIGWPLLHSYGFTCASPTRESTGPTAGLKGMAKFPCLWDISFPGCGT